MEKGSRSWLSILIGMVLGIGVAAGSWYLLRARAADSAATQHPYRPGSALFIVGHAPSLTPSPTPISPEQARQLQTTHSVLMTSPGLLLRVTTNPNLELRKTDWFKSMPHAIAAAQWLREHLRAAPIPKSNLIEIWLEGSVSPEDRKRIIQDVVSTHIDDTGRLMTQSIMDRMSMLNNQKIKLEMRLKDVHAEIRQKNINLAIEGGLSSSGKELELTRLSAMAIERQSEGARLKELASRLDSSGKSGTVIPEVTDLLARDERLRRWRERLDEAELKMALEKARGEKPTSESALLVDTLKKMLTDATAAATARFAEQTAVRGAAVKSEAEAMQKRITMLQQDIGEIENARLTLTHLLAESETCRAQVKDIRQQIEAWGAITNGLMSTELRLIVGPD